MEKLVKLFEPGKIGKMELKNRIILAPLGHGFLFATKPDGYLTDRYLAFYEARARGGVGFIQLTVNALGRPYATGPVASPGALGIFDDRLIPNAQRFTKAIHDCGTKVSFQITHHGGALARLGRERTPGEYSEPMVVGLPSGIREPITGVEARALTRDEILGMVDAYGQAARRGKAAGFDAVRIQACHHHGLQNFLSPRTNQRTDEYGGSVQNRARLPCEIIRRVRQEVGPDFPIIIRMNGDEFFEGGITINEALVHAKLFEEAGVDALDISSGPPETAQMQYVTMYQPFGPLVDITAAIKKAVKVPVIAVGKLDALHGEKVLREGSADFIQMARALMADPDLPNKAREGRLEDIRPCIYCGHCQNRPHGEGIYSNCTVNMALGKEWQYEIEPASLRKKVMVIGGGPGGMEAARTLAERGHDTSLYEQGYRLGGQWNVLAHYRPEADRLVRYLSRGVEKAGVKVFLNQKVTSQMVEEIKPDAVVVATGSRPTTLDIPGIEGKNVVQATDVLTGKVDAGQDVVIIGGRLIGLNTALFLAERGRNVSVVSRSQIAQGVFRYQKQALFASLVKFGVRLYPHAIPDSITSQGVNIWWDSGESPGKPWVFFSLKADTIVLAVGAKNENQLGDELSGIMPEVYPIGDCAGKRTIFAAMRGGSEVGKKI